MDFIFTYFFAPADSRIEDVEPVDADDPGGGNNNCVVA